LKQGALPKTPDPLPNLVTLSSSRDTIFLSTRGDPKKAIIAGHSRCHKNIVKCRLSCTFWGKLATRA